ncbi:cation diffusion facilitator family transporter [Azospirillum sp. TSO35-2]|uniref:cation diffusion facilitator family transporter n=1 Tax=Azospirillum sp. TSO35-2 TaxID=716796 RepID=UPI000D61C278|nr:cation diffusion facilitator family transporter [Azospirillum sp. TSO35-2]PWC33064.1 cation transporter [Azospirillum sp. TSO35-2]
MPQDITATERSEGANRVVYAAIAANLAITVTKFVAAVITGSSSMLSEAVHSLVDTGNEALMLVGLARSKRPPDDRHPFGYARELYFWPFVVALVIFAGGAVVSVYEGVEKILHPQPIESPWINFVVLAVALVMEAVSWVIALREFNAHRGPGGVIASVRASKDPTVFIVLFEDSAALVGLLIAAAALSADLLLDQPRFDGVGSVLIGAVLAITAAFLAYETKSLLIGEAARPDLVNGVRAMLEDEAAIDRVNEVLTIHLGPDSVIVNLSLDVHDDITAGHVETMLARIERRVRERYPEIRRVFTELRSADGRV